MSRTPKRESYAAVVRLAQGWVDYSFSGGRYEGYIERFRYYDEENAQALLRGARKNSKGGDKLLYQRYMQNVLPTEGWRKAFDEDLYSTDPKTFAFGLKLFRFCREELKADELTCLKVLEGFARYKPKDQRRMAKSLPDSVGGIGFFTQEHRDWLDLFHSYGNLYFESLRLEYAPT